MTERGMTDTEIGEVCGRDRRTVQGFRAKHGIRAAGPRGKTRRGTPVTMNGIAVIEGAPATVVIAPQKKPITVAEFLLNKRRAVCPVCQLKEPIRAAVMDAKKKGERTADILEYLQVVHRITILPRDYTSHFAGRHDQ